MRFFNQVYLRTPESVELEFPLAGIGNRAYALVVDYLIWWIVLVVFLFIWGFLTVYTSNFWSSEAVALWMMAIQILLFFAIHIGYFVSFETLWQGQTPGKRLAKIRVICDDGRPVGLGQATLRSLLRPVDDFFFIGVFLIVFTKTEKRLGDLVAGTLVIQEEPETIAGDFPIPNNAQPLVEYLKMEADLSQLLPDDFAVVREYLRRRKALLPQARIELARKLAYQVKDIISLEKIPEGVTASRFLEAIYFAYQQASGKQPLN